MDSVEKIEMKKKEKGNKRLLWQEKAAAHIAAGILRVQALVNCRLQKIERRLTVKQKKIGLFIFCLFSSIYLLYMLGNALFFKQHPTYYEFLRGQEKITPPQVSCPLPNTSLK